jgi:hypothetical protein
MQGRFKMEYRLFTIVRYNYGYYNKKTSSDWLYDHHSNTVCMKIYYVAKPVTVISITIIFIALTLLISLAKPGTGISNLD